MKIVTVIGTRPEIIKMSKLIPLLDKHFDHTFVFTGQHYSENMVDVFFDELKVRKSDYYLEVKSSEYSDLIKPILNKLKEINPDTVLVYGDTNSTLAAAIASKLINLRLIHVEAGLRSFDKEMPEEVNRVLTDHMSDLLFTPTTYTKELLKKEAIGKNVYLVGNTIVDAVYAYLGMIKKSSILDKLNLEPQTYYLLTLHRQETVDRKERCEKIITTLSLIDQKIVFPIHPRTEKKLAEFGLHLPKNILRINPLGYFDFLNLQKNAFLVMTDSGGVQEEAITLKVPCITLRKSTERMETVLAGVNFLAGIEPNSIKKYLDVIHTGKVHKKIKKIPNPYGDGKASEKIIKKLIR